MKVQKRIVCISAFISMIISALVTILFDVVSGSRWSTEIPGDVYIADRLLENIFLYVGIQCVLSVVFLMLSYFLGKKISVKSCVITILCYIAVSLIGIIGYVYIGEWFGR